MQLASIPTAFSIPLRAAVHPKLFSFPKFQCKITEIEIIALRALGQMAIALSVNVLAITFYATPISIPIITVLGLISFTALVGSAFHHLYIQNQSRSDSNLRNLAAMIQLMVGPMLFYTFNAYWPGIALHETGHVFCAWSFFIQSQASITLLPFTGCTTYTVSYGLTWIGQLLGQERALLVTAAGGYMASVIGSMMSFGTAEYLGDSWPMLSECLHYHAISQLLNEIVYGLTTFFVSRFDIAHDFIYLWEMGGVHPLVPLLLLSALLALQVALMVKNRIAP